MKEQSQSFFIDSTDGILKVFTTSVPEEPKLMFTPFERYAQLRLEYEQALELAKKEAVEVEGQRVQSSGTMIHQTYLQWVISTPSIHDGEFVSMIPDKIYTINMEEKIEKFDSPVRSCEFCTNGCHHIPECTTIKARIISKKVEVKSSLQEENEKLRKVLSAIVDATEDKGGQFRAWHNHLRSTTKEARIALGIEEPSKGDVKTGAQLIAIEREEQLKKHNRTIALDVELNSEYQLSKAAATLIIDDAGGYWSSDLCPEGWNQTIWDKMTNKSYKERLIIAGALIAAEIDRLNALK